MKVTGDFSSSGVNKYRFRIRERRGRESEEGGGGSWGAGAIFPFPCYVPFQLEPRTSVGNNLDPIPLLTSLMTLPHVTVSKAYPRVTKVPRIVSTSTRGAFLWFILGAGGGKKGGEEEARKEQRSNGGWNGGRINGRE